MRRRKHKQPNIQAPKVAKIILKPQELGTIYKSCITADTKVRVAALTAAVQWFDQNLVGLLAALPKPAGATPAKCLSPEQQKLFATATKAKNLGLQAPGPEEQETALLMCLRKYEGVWKDVPELPKIDVVYDQYKAKKAELEQAFAAEQAKLNTVLVPLNTAFAGLGVSFTSAKAEKARQMDGEGKIILSHDLVKTLAQKQRQQGLIPVLFSEAHAALYTSAMEPDGVNLQKLAKNVPVVFESILKYCGTLNPKEVWRGFDPNGAVTAAVGVKVPKTAKISTPRTPGEKKQPGPKVEKVAGLWMPGKTAAVLFLALVDEQIHKVDDLGISNAGAWIRILVKTGQRTGRWEATFDRKQNTVQMAIKDASLRPVTS